MTKYVTRWEVERWSPELGQDKLMAKTKIRIRPTVIELARQP
jgi:hypothetical protein